MVSPAEVERRNRNIREAMARENLDALIVCGNEYTGFEGAVRYLSGFEIVHRYVYVLVPLEGDLRLIFPSEARWIGDKTKPWVREHIWADIPGKWIADFAVSKNWKRLGVYGLDAVMAVRDYRELQKGSAELVSFDQPFDMARAVKSDEELAGIRHSMEIIENGFWAMLEEYKPGKTEAEIMAPAVDRFFAGGAGLQMMNIVLSGTNGEAQAHFKVPRDRKVSANDLLLYSLEIAGPEGYWVEFSRPLIQGKISGTTKRMAEVYPEALEAARILMRDGELIKNVHGAAVDIFAKQGFSLGHLSGHSIGMTMIEHPAISATSETLLRENMVFSFHPQVVDQEGKVCLYTQDTYRVGKKEGENFANVDWKFYSGAETPR
ncbi:MAG TPA: M24 family metallopeptidase [Candidatus Acidoferrales bacterium]